jgi:hypothetical protein
MNGRKYLTCRKFTKMGRALKKAEHWAVTLINGNKEEN